MTGRELEARPVTEDDLGGTDGARDGRRFGIELASVLTLVGAGARVAALDQHEVPLDGVVSLQVDLTDDGGVRAAVTRTAAAIGGLDTVVNNVGCWRPRHRGGNADEEWRAVLDVDGGMCGLRLPPRIGLRGALGRAAADLGLSSQRGVGSAVATGGIDGRAYFRATRAVWRMYPWDARHASQGPAPRHASIAGPFGPCGLREYHGWRGGPPHTLASRSDTLGPTWRRPLHTIGDAQS